MEEFRKEILNEDDFLLYIYTPMCATCNFARSMLKRIEMVHDQITFYQLNAGFYPKFMETYQIESVPCLLIQAQGKIKEKIYTFHSIPNIYYHLAKHMPELFENA